MSTEKQMIKVNGYISKHFHFRLKDFSKTSQTSMARLIAIAIDNEFERDNPFEYNTTLPTDEYIDYAYADEAGKILTYMKTMRVGAGLDILLLLRHDIKIPNREVFLLAFRELIEKNMVEQYKPKDRKYFIYPEDYYHYRITGTAPKDKKRDKKHSTQYEQYLKLKNKFEKVDT